jgi:hypothetical protein
VLLMAHHRRVAAEDCPFKLLLPELFIAVLMSYRSVCNGLDSLLAAAGFVRCDGPFTCVQARAHTRANQNLAFMREWAAASSHARAFLKLRVPVAATAINTVVTAITAKGLRPHDLQNASWADLASHGLVPASAELYTPGSAWAFSRELAEKLLLALPHLPPMVKDLQVGLSFFRLQHVPPASAASVPERTYIVYACGESSIKNAATRGARDASLLLRCCPRGLFVANMGDVWEDEGGEESDMQEWEGRLRTRAATALGEWVRWDADDQAYSVVTPTPAGQSFSGYHGDFPGALYFQGDEGLTAADLFVLGKAQKSFYWPFHNFPAFHLRPGDKARDGGPYGFF